MTECLSLSEIEPMSFEEMIDNEDRLPDALDLSTLDEENIETFKYWLSFANEDIFVPTEDYQKLRVETGKFSALAFASMPAGGFLHEGLHAIAARLTGGDFGKITISATELSTEVWCPTVGSYLATLLAPNVIAPTLGFYLMNKGWSEKNGSYVGVGYTTMMLGINPEPFGSGDCYQVVSILTGLSGESATVATIGFLAALYTSTFLLGKGAYKLEKNLKSRYTAWKQKDN